MNGKDSFPSSPCCMIVVTCERAVPLPCAFLLRTGAIRQQQKPKMKPQKPGTCQSESQSGLDMQGAVRHPSCSALLPRGKASCWASGLQGLACVTLIVSLSFRACIPVQLGYQSHLAMSKCNGQRLDKQQLCTPSNPACLSSSKITSVGTDTAVLHPRSCPVVLWANSLLTWQGQYCKQQWMRPLRKEELALLGRDDVIDQGVWGNTESCSKL